MTEERKDEQTQPALFSPKKPERDEMPVNVWAIAGLVALAIIAGGLVLGHRKPAVSPNSVLPLDAYAELEAFFDGFMLQRD